MSFTNEPLDLEGLPRLDETAFQPLDPAHLRLIRLGHAVAAIVLATLVGVAVIGFDWPPIIVVPVAIVVLVASFVRANVEVTHMGWLVREHDISYRSGVLVRSVATLPFSRVQHARIERGPLQRPLGLATLHVNSAGPDFSIVGLAADDAERLKQLVVERAGVELDDAE